MLKKSPKGRRVTSNPTNEDQEISDAQVDDLLSGKPRPKKNSSGQLNSYQEKVLQEHIQGQIESYVNLLVGIHLFSKIRR